MGAIFCPISRVGLGVICLVHWDYKPAYNFEIGLQVQYVGFMEWGISIRHGDLKSTHKTGEVVQCRPGNARITTRPWSSLTRPQAESEKMLEVFLRIWLVSFLTHGNLPGVSGFFTAI